MELGFERNTVTRKQVTNVLVDKLAATRAKRTTKVTLDETEVELKRKNPVSADGFPRALDPNERHSDEP